MNIHGLLASAGWGLLMAAVITPSLQLTDVENICGVIAGCLIISAIFNAK